MADESPCTLRIQVSSNLDQVVIFIISNSTKGHNTLHD